MILIDYLVPIVFTLLAVGLLYYYIKNKLNASERKLDLIFQLVQEHNKIIQLRNNNELNILKQVELNNYNLIMT